jgi:hypothetical protein
MADNAKPLPLSLPAPPPLPPLSVRTTSILAIHEQARDGRLSRGTIVGLATTAIAQKCRGTFVRPPPPPAQKRATAVRPSPPPSHERAREWPTMPRQRHPPRRQLVVAPVSEGIPTMTRHCKPPHRQLNITPMSVGRATMPRHGHLPHRQLVAARAQRPTMPCQYPCCRLHHHHCPQHQSAPPPMLLSLPSFPGPNPEGPPRPRPLAPNRKSTNPTSCTPIARWKAKTYGTAKAAKLALPPPPPPQFSSNTCAIAAVAMGGSVEWQHRMERMLKERRRTHYRDAQPSELERRPRGNLEKEGRGFVPPCHCLAAPSAWPAPPRTPTPRNARSTPMSLSPLLLLPR